METKQALSATGKICHWQENERQLGSAVIGTPLGIAPNAICCIITARMRRFVKSWALLDVPQRKHVMFRKGIVLKAQAAATGHEEAQAMATSQEKKSAATGDTGN